MSYQFKETKEQKEALDKVLKSLEGVPGPLMMAMQKAQDIYGYLPIEVMQRIATACNAPVEEAFASAPLAT